MGTEITKLRATWDDRKVIAREQTSQTLEVMLNALSKYGKPRLVHMGGGWYCCVDMYVSAEGVDFEVKTGFNNSTPSEAAEECCRRLDNALRGMGV